MKQIFKRHKIALFFAPILKVLEAVFELFIPLLIAGIINDFSLIDMNITFILSLYLVGFLASFISQYIASRTACNIEREIREKAFNKIMNTENPGREATNILTGDISQIKLGINLFIRLGLRAPVLMIGSIVMAFMINKKIAFLFLVVAVVITAILMFVILNLKKYNTKILELQDKLHEKLSRVLDGIKIIKTFNKEREELYEIESVSEEIINEHIKLERINTLANPMTYLSIQLIVVALLYIISIGTNNEKVLEGDVVALIGYLDQMLLSLIIVINLTITYTKTIASGKRVNKLLSEGNPRKTGQNYIEKLQELELVDVSYKNVLQNINFKINKGQSLGIIGPTGSGKTVLIELISKSLNASKGQILFDGIEDISDEYIHDNVATVAQKPKLFNDTIKNNIVLDKEIDDEIVQSVLSDLKINKDINEMVYENGKNLSGGEKQRLILARALIKNADLLLLDDSSSSLDKRTERIILSGIKKLDGIKVIVSSRMRAVIDCDYVLFLSNGNQVCFGTHEENLKNKEYRKFIESEK